MPPRSPTRSLAFRQAWGLIACLAFTLPAGAQTAAPDPLATLSEFTASESPPAIFGFDLNDSRVELFLQGAWKTGLAGALGFDAQGQSTQSIAIPGFATQPWYNEVNLLLELWLDQRFFLRSNLSDGFSGFDFQLGYSDPQAEGLNQLVAGNATLGLPSFPWLHGAGDLAQVPGMLGAWSSAWSKHWALIRLVNQGQVQEEFRGTVPVLSQKTKPGAYARSQFFQLPERGISGLEVWVEAASGKLASDGRRYRSLEAREFLYIDQGRGQFGLRQAAAGRVIARYATASGGAAEFPALDASGSISALDQVSFGSAVFASRVLAPLLLQYRSGDGSLDGLRVDLGGQSHWLLSDPGRFSLFEDCSWYPRPQNLQPDRVQLEGGNAAGISVAVLEDFVRLVAADPLGILERYPLLASRHPFAPSFYLPGQTSAATGGLSFFGAGKDENGLVLKADPDPSSIRVTRNGQASAAFSWDPGSRRLTLQPPAQADELILVSYTLRDPAAPPSLQFAQANRFEPFPWLQSSLGASALWPLAESGGRGELGVGAELELKPASPLPRVSLAAELRFDLPAANRPLMLQSYSGMFLALGLEPSACLPSNPVAWLANQGLSPGERGSLRYRDYRSSGGYAAWDASLPDAPAAAVGADMGPYLAAAGLDDPFPGRVALLDFALTGDEQWVALEYRLDENQRQALALSGQLAFWLKAQGISGGAVDLWAESGQFTEDLDADGLLEAAAIGETGLGFHDPASGVLLRAAASETSSSATPLAEDQDADGLLDGEGLLVQLNPADPGHTSYGSGLRHYAPGDSPWEEYRFSFGPDERLRLARAGALRLMLRKSAAGSALNGRILLGGIRLDLPGPRLSLAAGMQAELGSLRSLELEQELEAAFPEAAGLDGNAGQARLAWSGPTGGTARLDQAISPVALAGYRYFRLHLKPSTIPPAGGTTVSLSLQDGESSYASPRFDTAVLAGSGWFVAEFDTALARFSLRNAQGTVVSEGAVDRVGQFEMVRSLRLDLRNAAVSSGGLILDSLQADAGRSTLASSVSLRIDHDAAQPLWAVNGFPLVGGTSFHHRLDWTSAAWIDPPPGQEAAAEQVLRWEGRSRMALLGLGLELDNNLGFDAGLVRGTLGYGVSFPDGFDFPLRLEDRYTGGLGSPLIDKSSRISLVWPGLFEAVAAVRASQRTGLEQTWEGRLGAELGPLRLDGGITLEQERRGYAFAGLGTWFEGIGQGFAWYAPLAESLVDRRKLGTKLGLGFAAKPLSLGLNGALGGSEDAARQERHGAQLDFLAKLAIDSEDLPIGLNLAYQRVSQWSDQADPSGFAEELEAQLAAFGQLCSAWASWPLFELFDPAHPFATESAAAQRAQVKPALSLGFNRSLEPSWWLQILPKRLQLELHRNLERSGPLVTDELGFGFDLGWALLNLLGSQAAQPLFSFYQTDQLDLGFKLAWTQREAAFHASLAEFRLELKLIGLDAVPGTGLSGETARPVHGAQGVLDEIEPEQLQLALDACLGDGAAPILAGKAALRWSWSSAVAGLEDGLFNQKPKGPPYLEHVESFTLSARRSQDGQAAAAPGGGDYPAPGTTRAQIGHRSYLVLPGLLYIGVSLGYALDFAESGGLRIQAIRGGAEARITF